MSKLQYLTLLQFSDSQSLDAPVFLDESTSIKGMHPFCKAAVIIPAYNEQNLIGECLESIAVSVQSLSNPESIEIVVVDNNSSDDTKEIAKSVIGKIRNLHVIHENKLGIGYARSTGARFALSRAATRQFEKTRDFWLITTDADAVVPEYWLRNWLEEISYASSLIITGNSKFDSCFDLRYPNSVKLFSLFGKNRQKAEQLLGVINVDGFNSAVERKCYTAAGPYYQPQKITCNGTIVNLAGEDWDLSTRATALGIQPSRAEFEPVVVSSRRFEMSPKGFFDGTIYEGPFEKIDRGSPALDIRVEEIQKYFEIVSLRQCVHFVEKPILINPSLLSRSSVSRTLGKELIQELREWIKLNPPPDIFRSRNEFIYEYLFVFHEEFGSKLREKIFEGS